MINTISVRRYTQEDAVALWKLYHDTTHLINGLIYTAAQCERWAPAEIDMEKWATRLRGSNPFVAVNCDGKILGFAELMEDGEVDYFYCHHQHQREGIGKLLYEAVEAEALRLGLPDLRAQVSVTAKEFFLGRGFLVEREQHNIVCGTVAPNFSMIKNLTDKTADYKVCP